MKIDHDIVHVRNLVILSALEKSGEATTDQLARYTRTPRAEVDSSLRDLEAAGEVALFGAHWRPSHARVLDFAQRALRVIREQRERKGFGVFGPADAFANIARIAAELKLV